MWRVLTKQHNEIILSFLPVGHMKFFADAGFEMLKRQYRRTRVGSLYDIAEAISKSAVLNHCQLVSTQDGKVIVPTYDWAGYFDQYAIKSALKGIKKIAHSQFSADNPGIVFIQSSCKLPDERRISLLKKDKLSWRLISLKSCLQMDCHWNVSGTYMINKRILSS